MDDALHATKAALEEGIIPGGGIALLNATKVLEAKLECIESSDEYTGYKIIIDAIESPFFKILTNAGLDYQTVAGLEEDVLKQDKWFGYNPRISEFVNMFEAGIIDPTKVTRLALENAASVAGTMLITEAVVSKNSDEEEKNSMGMDPNMLMG